MANFLVIHRPPSVLVELALIVSGLCALEWLIDTLSGVRLDVYFTVQEFSFGQAADVCLLRHVWASHQEQTEHTRMHAGAPKAGGCRMMSS